MENIKYLAYTPTCPQGHTNCVYDPAYMKIYVPGLYAKRYGTLTPEEASKLDCCKAADCYQKMGE